MSAIKTLEHLKHHIDTFDTSTGGVAVQRDLLSAMVEAVELLQIGCEYASPLPPEFVAKVEVLLERLK